MTSIDLNADLGEGSSHDSKIIPLVSSVNISCGAHAGDRNSMLQAILLAARAHVAIGAHPGYDDRPHFGRRALQLPTEELQSSIRSQLLTFRRACEECAAAVHHVKPHGALYNQANHDPDLAECLVKVIAEVFPSTLLYCPPMGSMRQAALLHGLRPIAEGFIDRRHLDDGSLVPRSDPKAVISSTEETVAQFLSIALDQKVTTITGQMIPMPAKTLCIHGDGAHPEKILQSIGSSMKEHAVQIASD